MSEEKKVLNDEELENANGGVVYIGEIVKAKTASVEALKTQPAIEVIGFQTDPGKIQAAERLDLFASEDYEVR